MKRFTKEQITFLKTRDGLYFLQQVNVAHGGKLTFVECINIISGEDW